MNDPGMLWRHVVINTLGTWLHGDERGFRSRKHRIHSSGDYRHRPPIGELAGLSVFHEDQSRPEVTLDRILRQTIGETILSSLLDRDYRVLAIAVGKVHAHALAELPEALNTVKAIIGEAKRSASRAVKAQLPGSIWASGGTFKIVRNDSPLKSANDYILYDQGDAWTWSFRDRSREGRFSRTRSPKSGAALR